MPLPIPLDPPTTMSCLPPKSRSFIAQPPSFIAVTSVRIGEPCQSGGAPSLTSCRRRVAFCCKSSGISTARRDQEDAMTVSIRQLHPHFFGEVFGVDLRQPLTPQQAVDIEAG